MTTLPDVLMNPQQESPGLLELLRNDPGIQRLKNVPKGVAAGLAGLPGDVVNLLIDAQRYRLNPGELALDMERGTVGDYRDRLGTTDNIGQAMGADVDDPAFWASTMASPDPKDAIFLGLLGYKALKGAGKADETVEQALGLMDDAPRFEIDDSQATYTPPDRVRAPLRDVLDHPILFEAYPDQLDDVLVENAPGDTAYFDPKQRRIGIPRDVPAEQQLRDLMHEVNHLTDDVEGLPSGAGMLDQERDFNQAQEAIQRNLIAALEGTPVSREQAESVANRLARFFRYENVPGEVSSRMTEDRLGMSLAERAENAPTPTYRTLEKIDEFDRQLPGVKKRFMDAMEADLGPSWIGDSMELGLAEETKRLARQENAPLRLPGRAAGSPEPRDLRAMELARPTQVVTPQMVEMLEAWMKSGQ